jgi:hypothetical protein
MSKVFSDFIVSLRESKNKKLLFLEPDLQEWSHDLILAMQRAKLLVKAKILAKNVVCDGCEESCLMPVDSIIDALGNTQRFVVCEEVNDVSQVTVELSQLQLWQISIAQIVKVLCRLLNLTPPKSIPLSKSIIKLGMLKGIKGRRLVSFDQNNVSIIVNDENKPIEEVLFFDKGEIVIDQQVVNLLLASVSKKVGKRYVPSTQGRDVAKQEIQKRNALWHGEYERLKALHPGKTDVWISQKIAKMPIADGKKAGTIRNNMK